MRMVIEQAGAERGLLILPRGVEQRIFNANIIGILIGNLEGEIIDANEAFSNMLGFSREELIAGRIRWPDLTPAEWRDHHERALAEIKATGILQPFQKECWRKDGSRLPVMVGGAMFEGRKNEGCLLCSI